MTTRIRKLPSQATSTTMSRRFSIFSTYSVAGTSNPMSRAPCPNKLKTEALENSILKHMSENQGFRLGEIIRFVTGNVPSSATAMYHLFYRKLRKYIGNLKASGKISADNRLLNRSQQVPPLQVSILPRISIRIEKNENLLNYVPSRHKK